jgi:hypothetical protein
MLVTYLASYDCNTTISPPLSTRTLPNPSPALLLTIWPGPPPTPPVSCPPLLHLLTSHHRPRNISPSPSLGHPHQITLSPPYPFRSHHPSSAQAIIGVNGGKRVNRTSPEILVSRVCISAFVFSCFIHPLLTTCRADEEGGKKRKTHPQVVLNCSKTAINPSSLPFSCLNVIRVPCPLSPVPLMDEYVDRGEAGGFGEFPPPPVMGTA